jgi:Rhodopirellula transposase DDE domain
MGDPMRPLTWVSKSREKLACELNASGHDVSPNTIGRLLVDELEYSRQVNRKTLEGARHPDRNAQFEHINAQVIAAQSAAQYQEEGAHRQFRERRHRLSAQRRLMHVLACSRPRPWTGPSIRNAIICLHVVGMKLCHRHGAGGAVKTCLTFCWFVATPPVRSA